MCGDLCLLLLLLLMVVGSKGKAKDNEWHIGGVIDYSSRVGKEQMIAMQMAVQDFHRSACCKLQLVLHFKDSRRNLARAASVALELMHKKQVQAIIGTLPVAEATLVSMIDETTNNIPIISLTSPGILPPQQMLQQLPSILQMSNNIILHTQCIAAIVGIFKWRKVTAIYENNNDFSADSGLVTLSDSLRVVNSEVKHHLALPPLTSLSKPEAAIQEELEKLMSKSNRVLVLLQCSLELAILIFDKAKQMGMMEKGYVWIVSEEIASLLHSLDSSVFDNMQGVLGFRTNFIQSSKSFRHFKTKFRKMYQLKYPEEEEY
ncbi:hypothetical protein LWI28_021772 [Acer negundo]|uniref:Receptor ligand binding region domain-containing protein n=1 Tax=Acer negundo TaxID=4023 RepID=A0AAD5JK71_ACENE|nr:hypothetical protein LWI28_021772 [Acer negundo]